MSLQGRSWAAFNLEANLSGTPSVLGILSDYQEQASSKCSCGVLGFSEPSRCYLGRLGTPGRRQKWSQESQPKCEGFPAENGCRSSTRKTRAGAENPHGCTPGGCLLHWPSVLTQVCASLPLSDSQNRVLPPPQLPGAPPLTSVPCPKHISRLRPS